MSAEHQHENTERHEQSSDQLGEAERQERLAKLRENSPETDNANERVAAAREALKQHEQAPQAPVEAETRSEPAKSSFLNHKLNYAQTLASVQQRLAPMSRNFSKLIHVPIIEKSSEALEKTVARPSILLGATWTALIVGSVFFFTARHYGYALSGSELLFSLIVGAGLGILIEMLWRASRHH